MASKDLSDQLKGLTLENVIPQKGKELGRGAYGKVFAVKYLGLPFAAKEIHSLLIDGVSPEEKKAIKDGFVRECYHCSLIRHPNIVQFKGVYYAPTTDLPIMVMELMDTSLRSFIDNNQSKIAMKTKLSILHDVSLGLSYLHGRSPAVIHRDLSSNNVLLSKGHLVAKISDLGTAKMIRADSKQTKSRLTTAPGTLHFMPPEALEENDPVYGTPVDVFSFAGITVHLFSEEWPTPSAQKKKDPKTKKLVALSEAQRRQQYLDKIPGEVSALKEMMIRCLEDDADERPPIKEVSELIESLKDLPVIAEALQSGKYHIEWTTCADLPTPMYDAYVAVSNGTIYCTGSCPDEDNEHVVYCYDTRSNQWKQLPRPGHRLGVIHMVDNKLTIFGGRDSITGEIHNKVTTYDSKTKNWCSYYPNMLYNRHKPGVITSQDHVIVMGGKSSQDTFHDSIEVMHYSVDQLQWKETSVRLSDTMWALRPIVSDDKIVIVGYNGDEGCYATHCHVSVEKILSALDQPLSIGEESVDWSKLSCSPYYDTVTVPYSNPPVIIGGGDINYVPTSDIFLYDKCNDMWKKVDSLTSAKDSVGVALLNDHNIIVIGGANGGVGIEGAKESSLAIVEIGTITLNS